jgi:hypothetical protein
VTSIHRRLVSFNILFLCAAIPAGAWARGAAEIVDPKGVLERIDSFLGPNVQYDTDFPGDQYMSIQRWCRAAGLCAEEMRHRFSVVQDHNGFMWFADDIPSGYVWEADRRLEEYKFARGNPLRGIAYGGYTGERLVIHDASEIQYGLIDGSRIPAIEARATYEFSDGSEPDPFRIVIGRKLGYNMSTLEYKCEPASGVVSCWSKKLWLNTRNYPYHYAAEPEPCGLRGTVSERIADCARTKELEGGSWALVTKTLDGKKEVWKDLTSGLTWSDLLPPTTAERARAHCAEPATLEARGNLAQLSFRQATAKELKQALQHSIHYALSALAVTPRTTFDYWGTRHIWSSDQWVQSNGHVVSWALLGNKELEVGIISEIYEIGSICVAQEG